MDDSITEEERAAARMLARKGGLKGGPATLARHGHEHFARISALGVAARRAKKKASPLATATPSKEGTDAASTPLE